MLNFDVKIRDRTNNVRERAKKGNFESLSHAGGTIMKTARRSIRKTKYKPSPPGQPPHTREGKIRESILYAVDAKTNSVVIGPSVEKIDVIGAVHEKGLVETKPKVRKPNWILKIGGHGPILNKRGKKKIDKYQVSFIKIMTSAQLEKVRSFVSTLPREVLFKFIPARVRKYPKRPFMGPALEKMIPRIPSFWQYMLYR